MGQVQQLCATKTVEAITAARESIEAHLRATFGEIGRLQQEPEFLQNVEKIQQDTQELETWKVQREQLTAVESCAKTCTCDEGARLVIEEYNQLVGQAEEKSGLMSVPLPGGSGPWPWLGLVVVVVAGWVWWQKRRKCT